MYKRLLSYKHCLHPVSDMWCNLGDMVGTNNSLNNLRSGFYCYDQVAARSKANSPGQGMALGLQVDGFESHHWLSPLGVCNSWGVHLSVAMLIGRGDLKQAVDGSGPS